jgi:hypothetical protein
MVILRPTTKLRKFLPTTEVGESSDTALGDWYVHRISVGRQPLLLLVSSTSLLSILAPARDVRSLPERLAGMVAYRLLRCSASPLAIARELEAMKTVAIAPTCDRSVLGTVVEFARFVPLYLGSAEWTPRELDVVEGRLAEIPCRVTGPGHRTIFPCDKAPELLHAKWPDGGQPRSWRSNRRR